MNETGPIREYVDRISELASVHGVDAGRLAEEIEEHLAESASRYQAAGWSPDDAEHRAVSEMGDPETIVPGIASIVVSRGVAMGRIARWVALIGALLASAVLVAVHVDWDSAADESVRMAVVAVGALLGLCVAILAVDPLRALSGRARVGRAMAWCAAVTALGLASAWGGRFPLGSATFHLTGRPYLALVALLALLVAGAARWIGVRAGTGLGLVVAGTLALLANGVLSGHWRPLGSIGEGAANLGIELIVIGWGLLAFGWLARPGGASVRARVGGALVTAGHRLAPAPDVPPARPGAES